MKTAHLLYDGHCRFCTKWADFLRKKVTSENLIIVSAHIELGKQMVQTHKLADLVPSTLIYLDGNQVLTKTEAIFAALSHTHLKGWRILRVIPRSLRDKCYDLISSNRYLLGSTACNC